jgi:hypothetical protein
MKEKPFRMVVMDAEGGTHSYHFKARSGRHAKREACEWVARVEWATSLVEVTPVVEHRRWTRSHRLLALGTLTFVVSGATIAAMMIIGLSLEGAL